MNNSLAIGVSRKRTELSWLIIFLWAVVIFLYRVPDSLDLSRYYEGGRAFQGNAIQYLRYSILRNGIMQRLYV